MTDLDRLRTHAKTIVEGEGAEDFSPALVEAVAEALFLVSAEPEHGDSWARTSPTAWGDNFRNHARAALSTIRKHQAGE